MLRRLRAAIVAWTLPLPCTEQSIQLLAFSLFCASPQLALRRTVLSSSSKPHGKYFSNVGASQSIIWCVWLHRDHMRDDHKLFSHFTAPRVKRVRRTLVYTRCFEVRWKKWCVHICPPRRLPNSYQLAVVSRLALPAKDDKPNGTGVFAAFMHLYNPARSSQKWIWWDQRYDVRKPQSRSHFVTCILVPI